MTARADRLWPLLPLLAVLLLAAGLRFHRLGAQSLWNDEGNSVVQASRPLTEIASHAARDIHPPGYYWLLAGWRALAGATEFALRLPSALAGVLAAAFAGALARRLYGRLAAVVAAALVALNTFAIYYSQEARMYALLALWAAASLWAFVRLLETARQPGRMALGWAAALGLFNAAGLYTQYAFPLVMIAQGALAVWWLLWDAAALGLRAALRTMAVYAAANLLALALFLPWLPTALAQVTGWPNTGEAAPLGLALGTITGWLVFGVTADSANFGSTPYILVFLSTAIVPLATRPRRRILWRALLPVVWLGLTVGLFLALGLYREANLKFLLPAQIAFAVWMARSADVIWAAADDFRPGLSALLRTALMVGLGVLAANLWGGLGRLYYDPQFQRDDYRAIAQAVAGADAIVLTAPNQEEVFRYYYRGAASLHPLPAGLGGDDDAARAAVRALIASRRRIAAVFWGEAERDPNRVVETTLDTQAFPTGEDAWYGDVRLARYTTAPAPPAVRPSGARLGEAITLAGYGLSADRARPGETLLVQLDWQTDAPLAKRYKAFVQLLNADGVLVAQRDGEPGGGSLPTDSWQPGVRIADRHGLAIPADLPPGEYRLIAGLYDAAYPYARLPVTGAPAADFIVLATIAIAP